MILSAALSLLLVTQTGTPVCDVVTNQEAATLIGAVKSKQPLIDANTCVWNGDRVTLSIMRTPGVEPESAAPLLESIKTRARKGDVVADEPGIGSRAVSEVMARGTSVSIMAVAGTTMWTIRVEHVYSGLKADELLPKLRAIAKQVVTP